MDILKLLLIAHLIGDFFLQPVKLVEKKKNSIKGLIIHSLIYTIMITLVLLLFGNIWEIIFWSFLVFGSHFLIDYFRIKITKKFNNNAFSFWSFIVDQIIHVLLLVTISLVIKSNLNSIGDAVYNISFLKEIGHNIIINYILAFLIVLSPASVFIKHFFNYIFNKKDICENVESDNVGALIGMLERVVILLLGVLGLYGSIALVLTAKSLARFKQLEDKDFAEKYLVGTLFSLIIAILALLIIK
ncbi:MAG: DUF3307 domain-containing protein [Bacilli bacterium]|nr:DUF3307 domain-containing protein [Bacilli bacterium]